MSDESVCEVVATLKRSRKYAHVCPDTLTRIATWAVARHPSPKNATKAAKRKLHQIHGAYVERLDCRRIEELVASLPPFPDEGSLRATCRRALECHASTAERLSFIESLFGQLFLSIGVPDTVLDLACGLNPFALPWMPLREDTPYYATEIDTRLVAVIGHFLERVGRPGAVECRDLIISPPDVEADVALLLKTAPALEQQEKGATLRLLRSLRARVAIVSFPTKSLGGREKGMRGSYARMAADIAAEVGSEPEVLDFPSETFYILRLG